MKFWQILGNIDRRVIYGIISLSVIIPILKPIGLPINVTKEVQSIYNYIENLDENDVVLLAVDYDPATEPELQPMVKAVMRHCFMRNINVLVTCAVIPGTGLAERALTEVAEEYGKQSGIDYVFLGFKPMYGILILQLGEEIRVAYPTDHYNVRLDELPMMKNIHNYKDIDLVVTFGGSSIVAIWISYAHERYGATVAFGVTAVMATDYYPYLQSGQIIGMMGGLKGAAEYEKLINRPDSATIGMDVQSICHIVIILLIIIGNVAYFATRRK